MDTRFYQKPGNDFDNLSFIDLLEARDLYHVHLMNYPKVVATAIRLIFASRAALGTYLRQRRKPPRFESV
jgi:hypothetical protein